MKVPKQPPEGPQIEARAWTCGPLLGFRRKESVLALHHARRNLCSNNKLEFVCSCDSYARLLVFRFLFSVKGDGRGGETLRNARKISIDLSLMPFDLSFIHHCALFLLFLLQLFSSFTLLTCHFHHLFPHILTNVQSPSHVSTHDDSPAEPPLPCFFHPPSLPQYRLPLLVFLPSSLSPSLRIPHPTLSVPSSHPCVTSFSVPQILGQDGEAHDKQEQIYGEVLPRLNYITFIN